MDEERVKAEERATKADAIMEEQTRKINALLGFATDAKVDAEEIKIRLNDVQDQLLDVQDNLDDMAEHVDDIKEVLLERSGHSIVPFDDTTQRAEFILFQNQNDLNEYKFMGGIKSLNQRRMKAVFEDKYNIVKQEFDANPINLFRNVRETVKVENAALKKGLSHGEHSTVETVCIRNKTITLRNGFTQLDLVALIERVYNHKFVPYNTIIKETPPFHNLVKTSCSVRHVNSK
jgi:hypothetical protein